MNMIVCKKIFLPFFISSLTGLIVKRVIFWMEFTLSFLTNVLDQTFNTFNT